MKKYEIVLQNKKTKIYSAISWLIIALNFFAFLFVGISGLAEKTRYPFAGAGILLAIFIFQLLAKKTEEIKKNKFSIFFTIIIVTWVFIQFYWPAAINALLFIFNTISIRQLVVLINEDNIIYPSFPKKTILWEDLNNIILKDGFLTIDFKNNKLLQDEIANSGPDINENEFNNYCAERMRSKMAGGKNL